jgi:hypothetical protein
MAPSSSGVGPMLGLGEVTIYMKRILKTPVEASRG